VSKFGALKAERAKAPAANLNPQPEAPAEAKAGPRAGKVATSGYFSPDLRKALHLLALENGTNLQALMGEAWDDLLRKYDKHPFGER
jgi:hypothetical protein